jgi:hypothetical protein
MNEDVVEDGAQGIIGIIVSGSILDRLGDGYA